MNGNGSFKGQPAPCGQLADSEHYEDHDDDCVVTREVEYACGCVSRQTSTLAVREMRSPRRGARRCAGAPEGLAGREERVPANAAN